MDYIPNAIARSLVCQSSKTVGVIVSDISNPFFVDTINGIENILYGEGFIPFLCNTSYNPERESMYISQMMEKRVDGIIIFSAFANDTMLYTKVKNIMPFVSVQSTFNDVDCVNTTDEQGAFEAVDYLIKQGHRNIAFLVYDYGNSTISDRMKGYLRAYKENELPVNKEYIRTAAFSPNCGYDMTEEVLKKYPEVTAIFTYNDKIALDAYLAIQAKGLKIPEDISVVGYDDVERACMVRPRLTTVSQPFHEIGVTAAELLLKRIKENKKATPQTILLPAKLVVRESVKKLE